MIRASRTDTLYFWTGSRSCFARTSVPGRFTAPAAPPRFARVVSPPERLGAASGCSSTCRKPGVKMRIASRRRRCRRARSSRRSGKSHSHSSTPPWTTTAHHYPCSPTPTPTPATVIHGASETDFERESSSMRWASHRKPTFGKPRYSTRYRNGVVSERSRRAVDQQTTVRRCESRNWLKNLSSKKRAKLSVDRAVPALHLAELICDWAPLRTGRRYAAFASY